MKILAIDTSGQHASASIVTNSMIIGEIVLNARHGEKTYSHSEILMPGVEKLFELTGQRTDELTHIAYTCGPGSFTGLRIGASTALGLAFALNIKAIAVPTLDALAYNAYGMGFRGDVCPLMDARRGQVYFALFDSDLKKVHDYEALATEEVLSKLRGNTLIIGDGARYLHESNELLSFASAHHNFVRASSVGLWACNNLGSESGKMIYVRAPQAVREQANVV